MTIEEAIDRLKRIAKKAVHTPGEEPFVMSLDDGIAVYMAISALEQMEKAQPEHNPDDERKIADLHKMVNYLLSQQEQRWIPVTERLPDNDDEVLITVWDAEDDYADVYKGFYQDHDWWTQWCHGCSRIKDEQCGKDIVIAWMPLPEPWKGEKDE